MKKISHKIIFVLIVSAFLFLVGSFLFTQHSQIISPAIGITQAEGLHDELVQEGSKQQWIFDIWKIMLALANVIVIVMLLFVAVVNIIHLQYDTYAIKKSLPLLIIGIIMANFSLLICRMIVDAAQVLTNTFAANPTDLIKNYLCTMAIGSGGEAKWYTVFSGTFSFIVIIFFGLAIAIAVLILAFLLWMRKTVIFLLVAVAPLAFILYAFPPTQGLFKQWWSWFLKWTFMGPLIMLLVWAASKVGATNCGADAGFNVSAMFAVCGITYLAAIVPFKLGGPVMGAWGKAGQWLTGSGKGGFTRKPADEWWQRRKDQGGASIKTRFPRLFSGAEADRIITEGMKKTADSRVKENAWNRRPNVTHWNEQAEKAETDLKNKVNNQMRAYEAGEMQMSWLMRLRLAGFDWKTGQPRTVSQLAADKFNSAANLELSTKQLEAHRKDATWGAIIQTGRNNNELTAQLGELKDKGIGLEQFELNEDGTLKLVTKYKVDKDNNKIIDPKTGQPIPELSTYRDYMEQASIIDMMALATAQKDPEMAKNFRNSATKLRQDAQKFANNYQELNGKKINYQNFMDKNNAGRIFSVTTGWLLDEVGTNTLNENVKTMYERFEKGGYGWRNNRGSHNDLVHLARGEYSKVNPTSIGPAVAEYRTWLDFIGRKGGKDRGRFFADFLRAVDSGEVYGEDKKGALLRAVLTKENSIRQGATDEFLAEVLINAKRRGVDTIAGVKVAEFVDKKNDNVVDVVPKLKNLGENYSLDVIAQNPEMFAQLDLSPGGGRTNAQRNMLDGMADILEEADNFCGAGNAVGYTVKTKDKDPNSWFDDFAPVESPQEREAANRRREEKRKKNEELDRKNAVLSSSPEQAISAAGGENHAIEYYRGAAESAAAQENLIMSDFTMNGQPIDPDFFRRELARAINESLSQSFDELKNELQTKFSGLSIEMPNINTTEALQNYKDQINQTEKSLINYDAIRKDADAREVLTYGRVEPGQSIEAMQASLNKLEEAAQAIKDASQNFGQASNPAAPLPESVINKVVEAISQNKPVVQLSQDDLKKDDVKLNETLRKMIVGLKATIKAQQQTGGAPNETAILQAIKNELDEMNASENVIGSQQTSAEPRAGIDVPNP